MDRGSWLRTPTLAVALLAAWTAADRALDPPGAASGLVLVAALGLLARGAGLTSSDLGLRRAAVRGGLRAGAAAGAAVVVVYVAALALPAVRRLVAAPPDPSWTAGVVTALVVIPLATVLPEELAFRGVLWGSVRRRCGARQATVVSSVLFGLWHVPSALSGAPANDTVVGLVGDGAGATAARVVGTVLATGLAGLVFAWLRARSDSLLAPVVLHWAVNGTGVLFVLAA